jgi:fatty acid-binding protein DegV
MGNMLHIHPVIGIKDGVVVPYGKEYSREAAVDQLYG